MPIIVILDYFENNIRREIRILDSFSGAICKKTTNQKTRKKWGLPTVESDQIIYF